jgi:phytoene desaturase
VLVAENRSLHLADEEALDRGVLIRAVAETGVTQSDDDMNAWSDIPSPRPAKPHAVVIGSGFGGLAAAIRLQARGYAVTVLERQATLGGRAMVFRQDGFTFDAGPTIITAPFLLEELWTLAGARFADEITLEPISPFYRIRFDDGTNFDCAADPAFMREQVRRLAPDDLKGYERFVALSAEIYKIGFERLGHKAFGSWMDMARILPHLVRLSGYRSVYGLVARHVRDPRLRIALSFHPLLVGGNPFDTSAIYCLILHLERAHGVHFARGGTGELIEGLARLITRNGGVVRRNADVDQILVRAAKARGVQLTTGEVIPAEIVVSNGCAAWTYKHLLRGAKRRHWTDRRLERTQYSMGLFVWYFGTDRTWPDVPHHSMVLGPRYQGLLKDIFKDKILAEDFSLYLHRPTATDPTLAPPGCDAFYVLSPVPNLAGGVDWDREAEPYRQAIEKRLEQTVLPGLKGAIISSKIITPHHFRDNLLSLHGAGFGMEPRLTQSAWFRPHNKSEDIDNLFLVGASTHPGAGVPGVLSSARVLDEVVPHASALRLVN